MRLAIVIFVLFALLCLAAADSSIEFHNAKRALVAREAKKPEHHKHYKSSKHKKGKEHKHKGENVKHHKPKGHKKGHKHKHGYHRDHPSMRNLCAAKNPDAPKAIDKFCKYKKKITIPSAYALAAKSSGNTFAKINLPTCDPATKVGWLECRGNFFKVCAMGDDNGYGSMSFGPNNGCQTFTIGAK